jgi:HSP20 family molecular chaperone IbpA
MERRHGEFRRVLPLPTNIATDKVEAKFDHGLLKVTEVLSKVVFCEGK